jgi:hypothetical protein
LIPCGREFATFWPRLLSYRPDGPDSFIVGG